MPLDRRVRLSCAEAWQHEEVHVAAESGSDPAVLLAWVRERLDPEKRPRTPEVTDEPLRDDTGKVRRSRWRHA